MRYKLIAIDIDDTLITQDCKIPPRVMQAVERAKNAGIAVVLATGRSFGSQYRFYKELGLKTPVICHGGSEINDKYGNKKTTRCFGCFFWRSGFRKFFIREPENSSTLFFCVFML